MGLRYEIWRADELLVAEVLAGAEPLTVGPRRAQVPTDELAETVSLLSATAAGYRLELVEPLCGEIVTSGRRLRVRDGLLFDPRPEPLLRRFELSLLEQLGYGVLLEREADTDQPVRAEGAYRYIIERGPVRAAAEDDALPGALSGQTLLDMSAGRFDDPRTLHESKALLRHLIQHHLGGQSLHSRRMFKELQTL